MNDQKKNKNQLDQPLVRIEVGKTVLDIKSQSESNFLVDLRTIQRLLDGCIAEYHCAEKGNFPLGFHQNFKVQTPHLSMTDRKGGKRRPEEVLYKNVGHICDLM